MKIVTTWIIVLFVFGGVVYLFFARDKNYQQVEVVSATINNPMPMLEDRDRVSVLMVLDFKGNNQTVLEISPSDELLSFIQKVKPKDKLLVDINLRVSGSAFNYIENIETKEVYIRPWFWRIIGPVTNWEIKFAIFCFGVILVLGAIALITGG